MDLEDMLDGTENKQFVPQQQQQTNYQSQGGYNKYKKGNKPKRENMWKATDIKPLVIDPEKFNGVTDTFVISAYVNKKENKEIPDSIITKFMEVSKILFGKDFIMRYGGEKEDEITNTIASLEDSKLEVYLPYPKFNESFEHPILKYPENNAWRIAAGLDKFYMNVKPAARAIRARVVHTMLGKDLKSPCKFLLIYTECGSEVLNKETDYKKIGYNLSFLMRIAMKSNISIFNLKKDDAITRLSNYIKPKEEEN